MVTVTKPQAEAPAGPKASDVQRYKQAIWDSIENGSDVPLAVVEAAWKLGVDVTADQRTYRRRGTAAADLAVRVPALQYRANELADVAVKASKIGQRRLSEFPDITLAELWRLLNDVARHATSGMVSPEKLAASQAANEVSTVRQAALTLLRDTSDPGIGIAIQELQGEMGSIESFIANRSDIIGVDVAIARQEAKLLDITSGGRDRLTTADLRKPDKQVYREARQRLEALHTLAAQRPAALASNTEDEKRLVGLRARIDALERQRLAPREMAWHE